MQKIIMHLYKEKNSVIYCGVLHYWSGRRDSNPRPSPWQGDALPLSYFRMLMVAQGGIEPPTRGFSVRCSTN